MRATVDDPEMAAATGINVSLLSGGVFAAGAALAALGGVMGGPIIGGYAGMDFDLLPLAFVVVIIGGMGSLKGALVGAIVVGMIDNYGKALGARALVLHAVRADGADAGAEADRVVWPSVGRHAAGGGSGPRAARHGRCSPVRCCCRRIGPDSSLRS